MRNIGIPVIMVSIALLIASLIAFACFGVQCILESRRGPNLPRQVYADDDCRVVSFYDRGNWHYFARCPGLVEKEFSETQGKISVRRVESVETR